MEKQKKKTGIIVQIYSAAVIGIIIIGIVTYLSQYRLSSVSKKEESAKFATQIAQEVIRSVKEYQGYGWLLEYWHANYEEMDIDYDVDFSPGTKTEQKVRLLQAHQPEFSIRYAAEADIRALPEEDQKLYAEITYSWLITRVNEIKRNYHINFLYLMVTDTETGADPYGYQFFLLSGADEDSVRGTGKHEVYPMGWQVSAEENAELQEAMRSAVNKSAAGDGSDGHYDYSGSYADYYTMLYTYDSKAVLVGMSYKLTSMYEAIRTDAMKSAFYSILFQVLLVQLIIAILIAFGIRPLKMILENIRSYTDSKNSGMTNQNLEKILSGRGSFAIKRNEIGQLAEDFMVLTNEIDSYVDNIEMITKENERISAELGLASRIQSSMLPGIFPAFPERKEIDIYASMDPAREVGGDFYDFFFIDENHLALVMADVSGKGIPGALFMMISKVILQNVTYGGGSPAKILERTNNAICANNKEDMFVTVWLGILDVTTGLLKSSNAGHEYPALKQGDNPFELIIDKHGVAIGVMENLRYVEYETQLQPGDKIFVYTDGVPEATNPDCKLFGTDRMITALNHSAEGSATEILGAVRKAVDDFVKDAEQFDDLTMMCVEYRGPGQETEEA